MREQVGRFSLVLALVAAAGLFSALAPNTFPQLSTLTAILGTQAVLLIVALAVVIPLASGEFDLSVGWTAGLAMAIVPVLFLKHGWAAPLAISAGIAAGLVVGLFHSLCVVRLGLNAFVVTLATGTVLSGVTTGITGGETIIGVPSALTTATRTDVIGVPLVAWISLLLTAVLWYVSELTPVGRYLMAVGGNREAARLAGVPVAFVRGGAFVVASVLCAVAGVLDSGVIGAAVPDIGSSYLLPVYAAAFLGATSIRPGRFNAIGTAIALYLIATVVTGLNMLGVAAWIQPVFNGAALLVAIVFAKITVSSRTS